ncbi:hypothetical protein FQN54_001650 [Arachnomyces sp. PD_36]|nr:hypothetical protein FQN54_001650 [Arachnomyces sp. PD_36]
MALGNLPIELIQLIISHLEAIDLSRLCSTCTWLRAEAEDLFYQRAVEEEPPQLPIGLIITAISGRLYSFRRLLENMDPPVCDPYRIDRHPYTKAWLESLPYDMRMEQPTILHLVSYLGNDEMVKLVLNNYRLDPDEGDFIPYPAVGFSLYDGGASRTPLHRAAERGHISTMELLLAAGADINERDLHGGSAALDFAIEWDQDAAVEFIIRAGADVLAGVRQAPHITPLTRACEVNNQYMVNLLIASGARSDVDNALRSVAFTNRVSLAQILIDAGAKPGPDDLERAAHYGKMEMLQFLRRNGGKFDSTVNGMILHAGGCPLEITRLILNEIPQVVNTRDFSGCTPLDTVYRNFYGDTEDKIASIAQCLIEAGGEVSAMDPDSGHGWTTLHHAANRGHVRMVRMLLELGYQEPLLSMKDLEGSSALHLACCAEPQESLAISELLINAGIDIHIVSAEGRTPLHIAASACNLETIRLLIKAGVDISRQDSLRNTALHVLVIEATHKYRKIQGYASLAASIILGHFDVTIEDVRGERRLETVMQSDHIEAMRLLVSAGIDVSLQGSRGDTAIDIIVRSRVLGAMTPLPGNRKLEDLKGAGHLPVIHAAILEWISPQETDGPDGTEGLGDFWGGIEE